VAPGVKVSTLKSYYYDSMKDDSTAANDYGGSKPHKKRKQRDDSSPSQPKASKSSKKRKVDETAEDPPTASPAAPLAKEDKELQGNNSAAADETEKTSKKRKKKKSDVADPLASAPSVNTPKVDTKQQDSTDSKEASGLKMGQRMSYEDVREQERLHAEKEKSGKSKKKVEKKQQPNGIVTEEPSTEIATVDGPSTSEKKRRKKKEKVPPADTDATEDTIPGAKEEDIPISIPTIKKSKKKRKNKSAGDQTTASTEVPGDEDAGLYDVKPLDSGNGAQKTQEVESTLAEVSKLKKKRKHRDSDEALLPPAEPTPIEEAEEVGTTPVETSKPKKRRKHRDSNDAPPPPADPTPVEEVESTQVENSKKKKKRKHGKDDEAASASAEGTQDHVETPIEPQSTDPAPTKSKKRKRDRKNETQAPQEDALIETHTQDPPAVTDNILPDKKKRKQKHESPKPADLTDPLTILMPPPPTPDPNRKSASPHKPKVLLPLPADPPIPPKPRLPKSLRRLLDPTPSPFTLSRMTLLLDINPIGLLYAQETALAACLAPLVGSYFTPLDGLILSFHAPWLQNAPPKNLKRSLPNKSATRILDAAYAADLAFAHAHPDEEPPEPEDTPLAKLKKVKGLCHDEDEAPKVWISASFLLFRPQIGMKLMGFVNMQTESSVSLLLYNLFTVSIDAKRLGPGFKWVPAGSGTIKSPDKTTSLKSSPVKGGNAMDLDPDANAAEEVDQDQTALIAGHWVYTAPLPTPKTPPPKKGKSKSNPTPKPQSTPLRPGHALTFRILNYDIQSTITDSGARSSFVSIEGTLLSRRREREAREEEKERWMKRWGPKAELDESRDWEGAIKGILRKTRLDGEDAELGDGDVVMSGALVDDEAEEEEEGEGSGEDEEGVGEDLMDED
jgi:DNA-directed RNA polymerase I subunit RPA43